MRRWWVCVTSKFDWESGAVRCSNSHRRLLLGWESNLWRCCKLTYNPAVASKGDKKEAEGHLECSVGVELEFGLKGRCEIDNIVCLPLLPRFTGKKTDSEFSFFAMVIIRNKCSISE